MKVALVADIHSNIHALENALSLIELRRPDMIACAGDMVGYGAFPNECCALAEQECHVVISGNHDRAALSREVTGMNPYAAEAALWTADILNQRSRAFLGSLEDSIRFDAGGRSAVMAHGSLGDRNEYIHEASADEQMLVGAGSEILIMGHTHIPYRKNFPKGVVLNPGSVGQPRDGDPRGSFAVLDTETLECSIVRFDYPVDKAADAILSAGLPRALAGRLRYGR